MGNACWGVSEFFHMSNSLGVPTVQGVPLYANRYTRGDNLVQAVSDTLAQIHAIEKSVADDVPTDAQPFVDRFISRLREASEHLQADPTVDTRHEIYNQIIMKYLDLKTFPGSRSFGAVAKQSPDCSL